jgi:hypothetical protein
MCILTATEFSPHTPWCGIFFALPDNEPALPARFNDNQTSGLQVRDPHAWPNHRSGVVKSGYGGRERHIEPADDIG